MDNTGCHLRQLRVTRGSLRREPDQSSFVRSASAGTLMHEAGVSLKRAQEILGHASERTTLAIYTHSMRRMHDDNAD
jgi:integrase